MDGAISEFQQTVRDPRRKIDSLTMLGNCFIQKGMFDLAENQLQKALDETGGMSDRKKEILYSLGLLKERQDKPEGALEEYKKIYEVDINFRDVSDRIASARKKLAGS
jgi:tetratricopeptide (TPR) repeat protein